ncbi:tyrosine-type recombinase/integrase [Porticoccaceae bacterium LTM1]|nr:tyrosine-type recombinase/integrase [Porticoccaceae bacterium LTM1]
MSRLEAHTLLRHLCNSEADNATIDAIKLIMQTGCRVTEVCTIEVSDLRPLDQSWLIPAGKNKGGREHVLWLPESLYRMLCRRAAVVESGYLFRSPTDPAKHLADSTIRQAMKRFCQQLEMPHYSPHKLRTTVNTILAKAGYGEELRAKYLNHRCGGVNNFHYNAYDYFYEKREMAEVIWSFYISEKTNE